MNREEFMRHVENSYDSINSEEGHVFMFNLLNFQFDYDSQKKICSITCPVTEIMLNPVGIVHGGIYTLIADTAMGRLNFYNKDAPYVSLELKTSFFKAISKGSITATARYVKEGYRVCFIEANVRNEKGELLCTTSGTFYRFDKK